MIQFGSIEYIQLSRLDDILESYDKLDLVSLQALRTEVRIKIAASQREHDKNLESIKPSKQVQVCQHEHRSLCHSMDCDCPFEDRK